MATPDKILSELQSDQERVFTPSRVLRRSPSRESDVSRMFERSVSNPEASTQNIKRARESPREDGQRKRSNKDEVNLSDLDLQSIMTEVNMTLTSQKCSAPAKEKLFAAFQKINGKYLELLIEVEKLRVENRILREQSRPSYSAVAAAPRITQTKVQRSLEVKKHVLFITSEGRSSKDVQKIVTENIKPGKDKIKIKNLRSTDRTVIIETETEQDINKIMTRDELVRLNLKMEKPRKRNPLVILYDTKSDEKEEDLIEAIYSQNFDGILTREEFLSNCKTRFRTGPRNRTTVHVVLEMSSKIRQMAINKGRLYVGFQSLAVKDYVVVPRCLKCQDLGHVAKHCRKEKSTCAHCGEEDHERKDCGKKEQAAICIPCSVRKKKCANNRRDCPTHKILWDRLISKIDYGQ